MNLLEALAKKHTDWLKMAKSLKAFSPEDTVQEMYLRLNEYVKEPERIMYDHGEVNTLYVYFTLRNLVRNECKESREDLIMYRSDVSGGVAVKADYFTDILCEMEWEEQEYQDILDLVHDEIDEWYWYDKMMFNLYYLEEPNLSIRKLSEKTNISTSSIFNTLKNGREKIKHRLKESGKLKE